MNKDTEIQQAKNVLSQVIARRAMEQDPIVLEALEAKIKALEAQIGEAAKVTTQNPGTMLEAKIVAVLPGTNIDDLHALFRNTDSLVTLRIANSAVNNLLNGIFFNDLRHRDDSAKMGRYVGQATSSWGQDSDTSAYKDSETVEDRLIRLQQEVEDAMAELPRWVKFALDMVQHCKAEGKRLRANDEVPSPTGVYAKVMQRSDAQQADWAAKQKATKAAVPSILSMIK